MNFKVFFKSNNVIFQHSKRELGLIILFAILLIIWIFGYQQLKFSPTNQAAYPPAPFLKLSASDVSAPQIRLPGDIGDPTTPDYSNGLAPLLLIRSANGDVTFGFRIQASLEFHD